MQKCTPYLEQYMGQMWAQAHCQLPHTGMSLAWPALLGALAIAGGVGLLRLTRASRGR